MLTLSPDDVKSGMIFRVCGMRQSKYAHQHFYPHLTLVMIDEIATDVMRFRVGRTFYKCTSVREVVPIPEYSGSKGPSRFSQIIDIRNLIPVREQGNDRAKRRKETIMYADLDAERVDS